MAEEEKTAAMATLAGKQVQYGSHSVLRPHRSLEIWSFMEDGLQIKVNKDRCKIHSLGPN